MATLRPSVLSCRSCRQNIWASIDGMPSYTTRRQYQRPSTAPKPAIDLRHIRQNPGLYEQNCVDKNYKSKSRNGWRILELFGEWKQCQAQARLLRQRNNQVKQELGQSASEADSGNGKAELLEEARVLKTQILSYEETERSKQEEMEDLALELPNLSSFNTPTDGQPDIVGYINEHLEPSSSSSDRVWRSHVHIGAELDLLDFEGAAKTSGWGWYYLKNDAALLEQALVQYTLQKAAQRGWTIVTPPSMVYQHISTACGFAPRDENGEQQIYQIAQVEKDIAKPKMVMAGTAEIALAGMHANDTLHSTRLPLKVAGVSRAYRAEAGARGADTKGLYRVHEFTKVELFAWTAPDTTENGARFTDQANINGSQSSKVFDEMLALQKEILQDLGLHCRILEMPSNELGASAARKIDIEAYFPSRAASSKGQGWGEVSSLSSCTDYQSRRLATRVKMHDQGGRLDFAWTLNGTALAVPRVLAAILENGWDEARMAVEIPLCLQPYMGGKTAVVGNEEKRKGVNV